MLGRVPLPSEELFEFVGRLMAGVTFFIGTRKGCSGGERMPLWGTKIFGTDKGKWDDIIREARDRSK